MRIERKNGFPPSGEPGLFWLGQAGFLIETGAHRLLIDPYLSDSLAIKYKDKLYDHKRMMPAPVGVEDLPRPDLVLVTHDHSDHMDPVTLGRLAKRFPNLPFMVPAARIDVARARIGEESNLIPVDAGQELSPLPNLRLRVFPAAHESFDRDSQGRYPYLGYGIEANRIRLYHSGDSIPFEGLEALVADFSPQIALLPVNGRDEERLANGIPGNFTLEEAIALSAGIPYLIPHHFGMFAFNTIDAARIDCAAMNERAGKMRILRPDAGKTLRIFP